MKVSEVISEVMEIKPSQFDAGMLIRWLSTLEGRIFEEVFKTHFDPPVDEFNGYDENSTDDDLLVKEPYTDVYKYYLYAQIDFANQETDRYQNSSVMFNNAYREFASYWHSHHRPARNVLEIW